jgi:hypothetical protein
MEGFLEHYSTIFLPEWLKPTKILRHVGSIVAEIKTRLVWPEYEVKLLTTPCDIRYSSCTCYNSIYRDPYRSVQKNDKWLGSRSYALNLHMLLPTWKAVSFSTGWEGSCRHKQYYDTAERIMRQVNKHSCHNKQTLTGTSSSWFYSTSTHMDLRLVSEQLSHIQNLTYRPCGMSHHCSLSPDEAIELSKAITVTGRGGL